MAAAEPGRPPSPATSSNVSALTRCRSSPSTPTTATRASLPADRSLVNYDHPDSLDHERFAADVEALRAGERIAAPVYDFATHTRTAEVTIVEPRSIVIIEGILLLSFEEIADRLDLAVYLDVPEDVRLERRIKRDIAERGREPTTCDASSLRRWRRCTTASSSRSATAHTARLPFTRTTGRSPTS